MQGRKVLRVLAVTLAVGLVAGCGESDSKVKTVSVSGTVYLDGKPLSECALHFTKSLDHVGIGVTDGNGKYELQAEPGENKVLFMDAQGAGDVTDEPAEAAETDPTVDEDAAKEAEQAKEGQRVPTKYRDSDSAQKFNVPEDGATNADFKLTSD